jgi:hypothetical protein
MRLRKYWILARLQVKFLFGLSNGRTSTSFCWIYGDYGDGMEYGNDSDGRMLILFLIGLMLIDF